MYTYEKVTQIIHTNSLLHYSGNISWYDPQGLVQLLDDYPCIYTNMSGHILFSLLSLQVLLIAGVT